LIVVDANILIYAYNADAPQHRRAARWLTELFESGETIGIPFVTVWAFLRIATNSRIWKSPKSTGEAFGIVREWLLQPDVVLLQPGPRHMEILEKLAVDHAVAGSLMSDAILAALAIENGALLASSDQDFARFATLRWINPLKAGKQ
jgi:toxin-antitoxin system PIN domain toxin